MPEHPKFGSLSDRDAERIFRYLVGLAREDLLHRGFMLVLDRRREKWGTVKSCLNKVQKCFPAKISLVCLIKPQGFSQNYSKPGFVTDGIIEDAKIQVVSLNSVAELDAYIEKSQRTEDVGGTLDYRHTEWVRCRSAIETFQKNLQTSSERIEELQQGVTRTRLSPSVQEMEHILESQEVMWHDVKEDIESSRQSGVTLLGYITVHGRNKENTERVLTPDVKANAAELKEALTELESLENNFEKFWKSHKLNIQYWLKVCLFEQEMIQGDVVDGTNGPEARKKREQVMTELIETEKGYVDDLECIINGYIKVFEQAGNNITVELLGKKKFIFGNFEQIYEFHRNEFLCGLEAKKDQPSQVGGLFFTKSPEFEMYATYCKTQESSKALRMHYINLPFFKECQDKLGHELPLSAYLLKPAQRITKYQLLIREMMKLTVKNSTAFDDLEKALETMEGVLRHVNDVMHSCGIKGFPGNLAEQGKLLLQDTFMVWETKGNSNLNLLPSKGGKQRQVFMYQKMIIFSKKKDDTSRDSVPYHYKKHIKTCDMSFTKTVRGDPLKFELSGMGRSEVFVLQPSSTAVKNRWVEKITTLMWSQFHEVKEAVSTEQTALHSLRRSASMSSFATNSSENRLRSRRQRPLLVVGPNIAGGSNRVLNIQRFDDEESDTDDQLLDSSDSSNDCTTQQEQKALETMEGAFREVIDVRHPCGIKGFPGNLAEQGKLLLQDTFMVWETKGNSNLNLLPSKGGRQRQVFMYQKMIIFSKKKDDTSRDSVTYQYRKHIKTCDMALIPETVRGDPLKFELSVMGQSEVFVLQPSSTAVKNHWVKEIKNLIWSQFQGAEEAVSTEQPGLYSLRRSASMLSFATNSSENRLRSRRQRPLLVVGPNIASGSNRVSNTQKFDDDKESDNDQRDSVDRSDDCAKKQQEQTKSENMINIRQDMPSKGSRCSAICSFKAEGSRELSFQQGDSMELLQEGPDGWWLTRHTATKQEGWVRAIFLELLQS